MERGENTPEHAAQVKSTPPTLPQQAASLGKALVNWTSSGFTATPPDILATRESTCRACTEWDAAALNNTGRCRKCGCSTWAKIRMATERCPLGKWEAAETETGNRSAETGNLTVSFRPLPSALRIRRRSESRTI
jgi:hypothetical protein